MKFHKTLQGTHSTAFIKQVVKVISLISHKAALPQQTDDSTAFARWCHTYGHIGATWRMQMNLCFLWSTKVHNPNGKLIGSAVFAHGRKSLYFTMSAPIPKLSLSMEDLDPLGQSEPITQTVSPSVQPFLHR